MFKNTGGAVALAALFALSLFLLNCGSGDQRPAGLLYVISDAQNDISSYEINLDNGDLSLINSNAVTCTTLAQNPPVSCGLSVSMLLDPKKAVAFVLNQGLSPSGATVTVPPTIYGYTVNSDGSLSSPTTSATLPSGDESIAMTETADGSLLFVIDVGSTLSPTDCTTSPNNSTDCPSIQVFSATPGSTTLTQASALNLDRIPTALSALTFTPPGGSTQTLLFMTSSMDLTGQHNDNQLSVYSVDSSGNLTEQPNSPYTTLSVPGVVQAVNTNAPPQSTGGVYVYVGEQGSAAGSVSSFLVCTTVGAQGSLNSCTPTQVASEQLIPLGTPNAAGQNPIAMLVDPTNSFLYVASNQSNQLFAFSIAVETGILSPLVPASQPTGAQPVALAIHTNFNNSGEYLFTSNYGSNSLTGFSVGVTTGGISSPSTTLFLPGQPHGLAVK